MACLERCLSSNCPNRLGLLAYSLVGASFCQVNHDRHYTGGLLKMTVLRRGQCEPLAVALAERHDLFDTSLWGVVMGSYAHQITHTRQIKRKHCGP